ncbi:SLC13 family permease [Chloroflexota bacterium]
MDWKDENHMRGKRWIGPGLGAVLLFVFLLLPPLEPLTAVGMKVIGIFLATVIWWATVGIGYPSILCIALLAITGTMTPEAVFAVSWGNYLVLFILAVFGLAQCLRLTGFSRRFALWLLTRPFTAGHPWLMTAMFLLGPLLLGSVMSGTATCITFMAIAEPMLGILGYKRGDRFAATLMMGISWTATAAFITTPIGHASNIMLIDWLQRDFDYTLSFPIWMAVGIPAGLLLYLLILGYLRFVVRPDMSQFGSTAAVDYIRQERDKAGAMKLEEKLTVGIFLGVVVCWMLPGLAGNILPGVSTYLGKLGYAIPPLIGASLLCIIRVRNQPLMTFHQWMTGVPWETIALIAAIMVIRELIGSPETGIPQLLTSLLQPLATGVPFFVYLLIGQLWVSIQTNIMSNMVAACLVYGAMVPAAIAVGVGSPALGFTIFAGARSGFALPSATTNTALVTGSGWVPVGFMARHGFAVTIGVVLLCIFVVYPLASVILR